MRNIVAAALIAFVAACGQGGDAPATTQDQREPATTAAEAAMAQPTGFAAILAAQPDEVRARYPFRHPRETMEFFGIEPGMTVIEVLPGAGWYTRLLLPHLGGDGEIVGVNYATDMWKLFGMPDDQVQQLAGWPDDWVSQANTWRSEGHAKVSAFVFGAVPQDRKGSADAVLFIRALHNMARFEDQGGYLSGALRDAYEALKPGGIVGIVQHQAREDMPDEWANGSAGYLKESYVTRLMQDAGFEPMGATDINANPLDQPTASDIVWRLPPTLQTSREDQELKKQMMAIGESNRMTLKFRKPA